ncbi:hypothetical protein FDP41_005615 [Naegleria fowleri]|uniref:Uncharacterized protein n=1 Tax=Naegleria fowleri TaxID=5763 RepID=A0A6A5BMT9_NAEFO|nr:uncharacterized protein FDP41_005615 [Naegleria fowleri]KAF0975621.1 hypothetical protein FDP41_005615 [Naegleria fowleri]CAG4707811.1 unnamed protein product [Naegleria fowleri]
MFQGHYGPAGVLHFFFPDVSLVWLLVSTQLIDIAYFTLQLLCQMNVSHECPYDFLCHEHATFNVELMRRNAIFPSDIHSEYSHSLTGSLILTFILTILYSMVQKFNSKKSVSNLHHHHRSFLSLYGVLFLGVVSHWVLDVLVHRPDVTLFPPFTSVRIGLGMIGILAAKIRVVGGRRNLDQKFWSAFVVYGLTATAVNVYAYFGDDTSKRADQVVDGSPVPPDLVPLIFVLYLVAFSVSYFLDSSYGVNRDEGDVKKWE